MNTRIPLATTMTVIHAPWKIGTRMFVDVGV